MTDRDPLAEALAALEAPPLDPRFAARVEAHAKAELAPPAPAARGAARLRFAGALVPALLALAAVVETAGTASTVAKIYGKGEHTSSQ